MAAVHVAPRARSAERALVRRVRAQFLSGMALGLAALPVVLLMLVASGQLRLAHVTSGSMGRAVPVDALVVARPVSAAEVHVGDVVTFTAPTAGRPSVTHRVAAVSGGTGDPVLQTRGDANASADPWLLDRTDGPVWRSVLVLPRLGGVLASPGRLVTLGLLGVAPLLAAVALLRLLWRRTPRGASA